MRFTVNGPYYIISKSHIYTYTHVVTYDTNILNIILQKTIQIQISNPKMPTVNELNRQKWNKQMRGESSELMPSFQ